MNNEVHLNINGFTKKFMDQIIYKVSKNCKVVIKDLSDLYLIIFLML